MGISYKTIPFFTDTIIMSEIDEATRLADFNLQGKPIKALGNRLGFSSLQECIEDGAYLLTMRNGDFIHFYKHI